MRLLILLLVAGFCGIATPAAAEETPTTDSTTDADDFDTTTTSDGPDPSGCRPYCFAE